MQTLIKIGIILVLFWLAHNLIYLTPNQKRMDRLVQVQKTESNFSDNFENAESVFQLFSSDFKRWHEILRQNNNRVIKRPVIFCMVSPHECGANESSENFMTIEKILAYGKRSLQFHVSAFKPKFLGNSRIAIRRQLLDYKEGDEVFFSGRFYFRTDESRIKEEDDLNGVTFWALRTRHDSLKMFGEPGQRLFITEQNNIISDMKNWLPKPETFKQDIVDHFPIPKNEWVRIRVHMKLSSRSDGLLEVWQNDQKIIAANGQTLPTATSVYSILELGIIDNLNEKHDQTLYVDDVWISSQRF